MGPGVSYECQEQHGSHINEDHFYPEINNPETLERLPDGEVGELVFTTRHTDIGSSTRTFTLHQGSQVLRTITQ